MIAELRNASAVLKSALKQYSDVSSAISRSFGPGSRIDDASSVILEELGAIASYKVELDQSLKSLTKLRNRCNEIVPMNSLPHELLMRIFRLAHKSKCAIRTSPSTKKPTKAQRNDPLFSLHICSYWRFLALGMHRFWTHIDLAPFSANEKRLLERAEFFATHSGNLPMVLHIDIGRGIDSPSMEDVLKLCADIAPRTECINFKFARAFDANILASFAGKILSNCVPGKLTQLKMEIDDDQENQGFITANNLDEYPDESWPIEAPEHHLEGVLRQVTAMRLERIYPHWTSKAYSGLARLHLTDSLGMSVSKSALARVFRASPQLRYFRFGVSLSLFDNDGSASPAQLTNLESLYLDLGFLDEQEEVLSLILPGSRPLRMSIISDDIEAPFLTQGEHRRFFERSNVVQLHVAGSHGPPGLAIPRLLELVPKLKVLSLDGLTIIHDPEYAPSSSDTGPGAEFTRLHFNSSSIGLDALSYISQTYPMSQLTIDHRSCTIITAEDDEEFPDDLRDQLLEICPIVKFRKRDDPNGVDWD